MIIVAPKTAAGFSGTIIINEIGWMGTLASANDEWIELYNLTNMPVDLSGWRLEADDDTPQIVLNGMIASKGVFLLERTTDSTVSTQIAQQIYSGALSNTVEYLRLKNADGQVIDEVDSWHAGSNSPKASMVRVNSGLSGISPAAWASATIFEGARDAAGNEIIGSPGLVNKTQGGDSNIAPEDTNTPAEITVPSGKSVAPGPELLGSLEIYTRTASNPIAVALDQISLPVNTPFDLEARSSEPLDINWILGNGEKISKTTNLTYSFAFPGTYFIILEGIKGGTRVLDQLEVFVYADSIRISEFLPNPTGTDQGYEWLELENTGAFMIDLGGFKLNIGATTPKKFTLPSPTFIGPRSYLVIPLSATSQSLGNSKGVAELMYPNELVIDTINYENAPEGYSAVRHNQGFVWSSKPTPGFANVLNPETPLATSLKAGAAAVSELETTKLEVGDKVEVATVNKASLSSQVIAAPAASFQLQTPDAYATVPSLSKSNPHTTKTSQESEGEEATFERTLTISEQPVGSRDGAKLMFLVMSIVTSLGLMTYALVSRSRLA